MSKGEGGGRKTGRREEGLAGTELSCLESANKVPQKPKRDPTTSSKRF